MKKIYVTCASFVAIILALAFAGPGSTVAHETQQQKRNQPKRTDQVRRRAAKARKRARQHAVNYVCPMHSDMRSRTRSECPKCGMELVVEKEKK
ncbi:MAG TPA: heavy metal-binding domain-containing protein [Pyrinomonadaceae bacterium]